MDRSDISNSAVFWDVYLNNSFDCDFFGKFLCPEESSCPICLDTLKDSYVIMLPCKHVYHRDCFYRCLFDYNKKHCPDCDAPLKKKVKEETLNKFLSN